MNRVKPGSARWRGVRRIPVGLAFALSGVALSVSATPDARQIGDQSPAASQPASAPAAAVKLEDFAWLAGRWVGESGKARSEEIWSRPDGRVMIGMFRLMAPDGSTRVIEIETLRQVGSAVEIRFRHFNEDLVAWEAPESPAVMICAQASPGEFVFVNPSPHEVKPGQPLRQVWKRSSADGFRYEVYALRDGAETLILSGEMKRTAL